MSALRDQAGQEVPLAITLPDQDGIPINIVSAFLSPVKQVEVHLEASQTSPAVSLAQGHVSQEQSMGQTLVATLKDKV